MMKKKKKYNFVYPSLLLSSNMEKELESDSWFDIIKYDNQNHSHIKKDIDINVSFLQTIKIKLDFPDKCSNILLNFLDDCIDIYNFTNDFIKQQIKEKLITNKNFKSEVNYYKIRKILKDKISSVCKKNKMNKHSGDYAVKHCVEMYKSAFSNKKNTDLFCISNLEKNRRKKNMVIEPTCLKVNKNKNKKIINDEIYFTFLKENIKCLSKLNIEITKNTLLQYDKIKKQFCLIIPYDDSKQETYHKYKKCGIDIGVRTFLTTYSPEGSYEIGTCNKTYNKIDAMNKKMDSLKSRYEDKKISPVKYETTFAKYSDRLKNRMKDMHCKTANFLLKKYETILIGKVSTKNMVSKEGNLGKSTKRRLMSISHYKFIEKLITMSKKFGTKIKLVSEYMTTQTCHNCLESYKIGSSKIYKCKKCGLEIDRDINSAINIYKNIKLERR